MDTEEVEGLNRVV